MPNTVTNTRLLAGKKKVVQYICIHSDGSEETDLVIYDSSAVATAVGATDPLDCSIDRIIYSTNSLAGVVEMEFKANTDVLAWACPAYSGASEFDFSTIGGLNNYAGAGKNGDITLTTTGLASGDAITIILVIDPEIS